MYFFLPLLIYFCGSICCSPIIYLTDNNSYYRFKIDYSNTYAFKIQYNITELTSFSIESVYRRVYTYIQFIKKKKSKHLQKCTRISVTRNFSIYDLSLFCDTSFKYANYDNLQISHIITHIFIQKNIYL